MKKSEIISLIAFGIIMAGICTWHFNGLRHCKASKICRFSCDLPLAKLKVNETLVKNVRCTFDDKSDVSGKYCCCSALMFMYYCHVGDTLVIRGKKWIVKGFAEASGYVCDLLCIPDAKMRKQGLFYSDIKIIRK